MERETIRIGVAPGSEAGPGTTFVNQDDGRGAKLEITRRKCGRAYISGARIAEGREMPSMSSSSVRRRATSEKTIRTQHVLKDCFV